MVEYYSCFDQNIALISMVYEQKNHGCSNTVLSAQMFRKVYSINISWCNNSLLIYFTMRRPNTIPFTICWRWVCASSISNISRFCMMTCYKYLVSSLYSIVTIESKNSKVTIRHPHNNRKIYE